MEKDSELKMMALRCKVCDLLDSHIKNIKKILEKMKDDPKGKEEAVIKQLEEWPLLLKVVFDNFEKDIKDRAESGCIIAPDAVAKEEWGKIWEEYLSKAIKLDDQRQRIMANPKVIKMMHRPNGD